MNHISLEFQNDKPIIEIPKGIVELYELKQGQKFGIKTKEFDEGKMLSITIYTSLIHDAMK